MNIKFDEEEFAAVIQRLSRAERLALFSEIVSTISSARVRAPLSECAHDQFLAKARKPQQAGD